MATGNEQEFEKLTNLLHHHKDSGSVLAVVVVDDWELETEIAGRLYEDLAQDFEISSWAITPDYPSVLGYLQQAGQNDDAKPNILIVEGWRDLSMDQLEWAISRLNQERDAFNHSIVFLIPSDIVTRIQTKAYDFWSCIMSFKFARETEAAERYKRQRLRKFYFEYLRERHKHLDFQGMVPLKEPISLPLFDLFVPIRVKYNLESANKSEPLDFRKLLTGQRRAILLGEPGAGKTTVLSYIALALVEGAEAVQERLKIDRNKLWFPLLFPISAYAQALHNDPDLSLADYLPRYFKGREQGGLKPLFDYELEHGNCLVLLDGLDEIVMPSERFSVLKRIQDFIFRFENNRFIITSRPASYAQTHFGDDFALITIAPFTKEEIALFIDRWFKAFDQRRPDGGVESRDPEELIRAINSNQRVLDLAKTPLLLSIIIMLYYYRGARFPNRRFDLYEQCVEVLAETWNWTRSIAGRPVSSEEFQFNKHYVSRVLGPIALWMHNQPGNYILRSNLEERISLWLQEQEGLRGSKASEQAASFIDIVAEQSGLLVKNMSDEVSFPHKTFEEYFVAIHLKSQQNPNEIICDRMGDPRWAEIIRLTVGSSSGERLENLFLAMMQTADNHTGSDKSKQSILIGECLLDAGFGAVKVTIRNKILQTLEDVINDSNADFKLRRDAATVLGDLGDPRLGKLNEVPAGVFLMGLSAPEIELILKEGDRRADLRRILSLASPSHEATVNTFHIDCYPVTNWQYKQFIDEGGYNTQQFWSENGWQWRFKNNTEPSYWDDDDLGIRKPNKPVVGVSWHEAEAFCNWRSTYMTKETGQKHIFRLPTEAEWEWAARGDDKRWWPWGKRWLDDSANANYKVGSTTPVGIYPAGASSFGVLDMAGNVREWTLDRMKLYDADAYDSTNSRVIRGGAWNDLRWRIMCTARQAQEGNQRHGAIGFRCVLVEATDSNTD